jgi:hypothetical protein
VKIPVDFSEEQFAEANNSTFGQLIEREILFIKEVITKEESITPKANLSA